MPIFTSERGTIEYKNPSCSHAMNLVKMSAKYENANSEQGCELLEKLQSEIKNLITKVEISNGEMTVCNADDLFADCEYLSEVNGVCEAVLSTVMGAIKKKN